MVVKRKEGFLWGFEEAKNDFNEVSNNFNYPSMTKKFDSTLMPIYKRHNNFEVVIPNECAIELPGLLLEIASNKAYSIILEDFNRL